MLIRVLRPCRRVPEGLLILFSFFFLLARVWTLIWRRIELGSVYPLKKHKGEEKKNSNEDTDSFQRQVNGQLAQSGTCVRERRHGQLLRALSTPFVCVDV